MPITRGKKDISVRRLVGPLEGGVSISGGKKSITSATSVELDISYKAGEDLTAWYLGSIGDDGKLYHASPLAADNLPVNGFIVKDANEDSIAYLREDRIGSSLIELTLGNDEPIFLRADDGTSNYSQTPLETPTGTEDLFQVIGRPSTINSILINIREPEEFL